MDRFEALRTFVTVVESGQISAAADRLGCAKSVVSRRISDLETRLGAQLLRRTTRRLSATDAGRDLHQRAVRLLAELEEAEQSVSSGQASLSGRLRLAAPLSFGLLHLVPALNPFLAEHPDLVLDLDLNDRWTDLIDEGVDLALRIGRLDDSSLVARKIAPIRMLLCASPGYLARWGTPQTPEELAGHRGLIYGNVENPNLWRFTDEGGVRRTVRVPIRMQANNGDVLLEAAASGLGVCMTPTFIAYRAVIEGRLLPILSGFLLEEATAYLVYPTRRFVPQRVKALIHFLLERFGKHPYWDRGLDV